MNHPAPARNIGADGVHHMFGAAAHQLGSIGFELGGRVALAQDGVDFAVRIREAPPEFTFEVKDLNKYKSFFIALKKLRTYYRLFDFYCR